MLLMGKNGREKEKEGETLWNYGSRFIRVKPCEYDVEGTRKRKRPYQNIQLLRTDFKNLIPLLYRVKGNFTASRIFYLWEDFLVYEYGNFPVLFLHTNGKFYVERAWLSYSEWSMIRLENHATFYARQLKDVGALHYKRGSIG